MDPDRVLTNAELLEELRRIAEEVNFRLENYIVAAEESRGAADEGYLLAQKADGIWKADYGDGSSEFGDGIWTRTHKLERLIAEARNTADA